MGVCYSEDEDWETDENYRKKRKNRRKKKQNSVIYEQKTIYEPSFSEAVQSSFREDIHKTLNYIASEENIGSFTFGSVSQLTDKQLEALQKSLEQINLEGQDFNSNQSFTLCNLKTKNFLHTHKIRHKQLSKFNQVSACPYTSNHVLEYDIWKIYNVGSKVFIYHPFTGKYLGVQGEEIICQDQQFDWKIVDFGRRRNGGFIKLKTQEGELCMTDEQGLLSNHRKLHLCKGKHIGHLWQINFGECILD